MKESVRAATTELVSKSKVLDRAKEEELPHFDLPEIDKGTSPVCIGLTLCSVIRTVQFN